MNEKASEMISELTKIKEYSHMDFLYLACIILVNHSELLPIKLPTKHIVGMIIDGELELKKDLNNGILSIKS